MEEQNYRMKCPINDYENLHSYLDETAWDILKGQLILDGNRGDS
jgi:hypothetical protein